MINFSGGASTSGTHYDVDMASVKPRQKLLLSADVIDLLVMFVRIDFNDIETLRFVGHPTHTQTHKHTHTHTMFYTLTD